jgi:uncharacterized coiled-coil protein SlyX
MSTEHRVTELERDLAWANETIEQLKKQLKEKEDIIERQKQENAELNANVDLLTRRVDEMQQENFKYQEKVIELIDDSDVEEEVNK